MHSVKGQEYYDQVNAKYGQEFEEVVGGDDKDIEDGVQEL
jgi:hypothetical protein